jgi:hypothetical protein
MEAATIELAGPPVWAIDAALGRAGRAIGINRGTMGSFRQTGVFSVDPCVTQNANPISKKDTPYSAVLGVGFGRPIRASLNDGQIIISITHWYNCCAVPVSR